MLSFTDIASLFSFELSFFVVYIIIEIKRRLYKL